MIALPAIAMLLAVMSWGVSATTALAATSVTAGWWTGLPTLVAGPDAPGDELVVQGGRDTSDPTSYAAVAYTLEPEETPLSLTLTVTEGSASTPNATLVVCALTETFTAAQGGPMTDAPEFDCTSSVEASLSDDGSSYEFDVAGLGEPDTLALAVLPTRATDRVVLDTPDAASLTTTPGTLTDAGATPGGSASDTTDFNGPTPDDSGSIGSVGSPTDLDLDAPQQSDAPEEAAPSDSTEEPQENTELSAPSVLASQPAGTAGDGSAWQALGFVALALLAATMWLFAGRSGQAPIMAPAPSAAPPATDG